MGVCAQSCRTPCDPMDWSTPGSSVHAIFQARMLECFANPSSNGQRVVRTLHYDTSVLGGPTWHGS